METEADYALTGLEGISLHEEDPQAQAGNEGGRGMCVCNNDSQQAQERFFIMSSSPSYHSTAPQDLSKSLWALGLQCYD